MKFGIKASEIVDWKKGFGVGVIVSYDDKLVGLDLFFLTHHVMIGWMK